MQAIKTAVAFLFRRAAEDEVSEDAFVRAASLDLHWFSPRDARRFLEAARALGHVKPGSQPGRVAPAFAVADVEVPLDFRIDARALEGAPTGVSCVAEELVTLAAAARRVTADQVWKEVAQKRSDRLVEDPVAAALIAAEAGVDLTPFFSRIREELARLARQAAHAPSP